MLVNIKEANYWAIYDFANGRNRPEMQGTKLQALFKLIQKKGEEITTQDTKLNGIKALQISGSEFIAITRTPVTKQSFYPCMLKTYLLTTL
jgi:hypothetical protein